MRAHFFLAVSHFSLYNGNNDGDITDTRANYDLQQVVMVYIGEDKKRLQNRLLSMLYDLFKADGSAAEKKQVLREKYDVILDRNAERMVDTMCNLSEGIYDRGYGRGKIKGRTEGEAHAKEAIVLNMLKRGVPVTLAAEYAEVSREQVRKIGYKNGLLS